MELSNVERKVLEAIDCRAEDICAWGEKLFATPELGYKEFETSRIIQEELEKLGIDCSRGHAVTGVKGVLKGEGNFKVAVLGELDAVVCKAHPAANAETGAAHACGHHAQLAAMLGVAAGLVDSGIMEELAGNVVFLATPAEEYIDLDYRRSLQREGKIQYFGGKQQLIQEGIFEDIDAAMMVHAQPDTPQAAVYVHGSSLGFVEKKITFRGRAAHASEPYKGVNALNAAALAILGMHANRERFREEDKIRVHPIITKGGDVVNSVPEEVCMDSYVRGASMEAIRRASEDTDRAIQGAAQMVGAEADIQTVPGYAPLRQNYALGELFQEAAELFVEPEQMYSGIDMVGSTDIGDLSHILPCIQPTVGGFTGELHSKEFEVADPYTAYVLPAKMMALTVVRLLADGGQKIQEVKAKFGSDCGKK